VHHINNVLTALALAALAETFAIEAIDSVKVGDTVQITYTQALAISVK
jgi:hypothetical protein